MSVYTTVSPAQLSAWLARFELGTLTELRAIAAGIENTNYFVTTSAGRFVLTLFEKLQPAELPFYLGLMTHLSGRGIPCPRPIPDRDGAVLGELCGKPATLVSRLSGHDVTTPTAEHCARVGAMLARMHLAASDYPATMPNPRGLAWWRGAALEVLPRMPANEATLLKSELDHQSAHRAMDLPRGAIHADLFRDNVLFDAADIGGVIDFYFACTDTLLYDLAITVNDWCIGAHGELDEPRARALLGAYCAVRPLAEGEPQAWPVLLRAGALRFWISRLYDLHCPRPGELTFAKDPAHFRNILLDRIQGEAQSARILPA